MHQRFIVSFFAVSILGASLVCSGSQPGAAFRAVPTLSDAPADLSALKAISGVPYETTATEHFVMFHERGADYTASAGRTLEYAYEHFYNVLSKAGFKLSRPTDRLVWICFPQQDGFNKYALQAENLDLSWLDGYYSTLTNRVAVVQPSPRLNQAWETEPSSNAGFRITLAAAKSSVAQILPMSGTAEPLDVARLTHELAHQLAFNSGLQKRGVMYPLWVSEGLATNFEFDWSARTGFQACNGGRRECLIETHAAGELLPLRQFITQTKVPAGALASRQYYAQAWAFFQYILTERPGDLNRYLERLTRLPPGRRGTDALLREFTDAFGSPENLESSWSLFLADQTRPGASGSLALRPRQTHTAQLP